MADMNAKRRRRTVIVYGSKQGNSVLHERDVLEISRLCRSGVTQKEAGAKFGISQSHVSHIMRGAVWSQVTCIARRDAEADLVEEA